LRTADVDDLVHATRDDDVTVVVDRDARDRVVGAAAERLHPHARAFAIELGGKHIAERRAIVVRRQRHTSRARHRRERPRDRDPASSASSRQPCTPSAPAPPSRTSHATSPVAPKRATKPSLPPALVTTRRADAQRAAEQPPTTKAIAEWRERRRDSPTPWSRSRRSTALHRSPQRPP
jgi:hypothetical protein